MPVLPSLPMGERSLLDVCQLNGSLESEVAGRPPEEQSQHNQRHPVAPSHRRAVARCAGEVREMDLNLSTLFGSNRPM